MKTQISITAVIVAADALARKHGVTHALVEEVRNMVGSATDNANDTFADGAPSDAEWEDVAIRSLASELCESYVSAKARKFFETVGVVY